MNFTDIYRDGHDTQKIYKITITYFFLIIIRKKYVIVIVYIL